MTCGTELPRRYHFFHGNSSSYNLRILNIGLLIKDDLVVVYIRPEEMQFYRLAWREGSKLCMSDVWHLNKM